MKAETSGIRYLAGKSNLMDAVSFVVGLSSKDLRGRQLKDLIYRATTDKGDGEARPAFAMYACTSAARHL